LFYAQPPHCPPIRCLYDEVMIKKYRAIIFISILALGIISVSAMAQTSNRMSSARELQINKILKKYQKILNEIANELGAPLVIRAPDGKELVRISPKPVKIDDGGFLSRLFKKPAPEVPIDDGGLLAVSLAITGGTAFEHDANRPQVFQPVKYSINNGLSQSIYFRIGCADPLPRIYNDRGIELKPSGPCVAVSVVEEEVPAGGKLDLVWNQKVSSRFVPDGRYQLGVTYGLDKTMAYKSEARSGFVTVKGVAWDLAQQKQICLLFDDPLVSNAFYYTRSDCLEGLIDLVITSLSPTSGSGGTYVTITGTGFTPADNRVRFSGTVSGSGSDPIVNLPSPDGKTITFQVLVDKPGTYYFSVQNNTRGEGKDKVPFTVTAP